MSFLTNLLCLMSVLFASAYDKLQLVKCVAPNSHSTVVVHGVLPLRVVFDDALAGYVQQKL